MRPLDGCELRAWLPFGAPWVVWSGGGGFAPCFGSFLRLPAFLVVIVAVLHKRHQSKGGRQQEGHPRRSTIFRHRTSYLSPAVTRNQEKAGKI